MSEHHHNGNPEDLFAHRSKETVSVSAPLADRLRPKSLEDFLGQENVVGTGSPIRNAIAHDRIFSMILWGPPGCGKTTLARIIAGHTKSDFAHFSAVLSGVKEIRQVIEEARRQLNFYRKRTVLFVDEIHRFNKSQQDAFLHHVESGLITLIGATTENPSFEVIPALLSRCRVIVLHPLSDNQIRRLLHRALKDEKDGLGHLGLSITDDAANHIVAISDGDARAALNALEISVFNLLQTGNKRGQITLVDVEKASQRKALLYDKSGEQHYNLISAFHKSLRGSDPDAALYWLARMLMGGEDPLYVARRMVRFASEDVGNADPRALSVTMEAMRAYQFLGSPEGDLHLAQAATYLATAPKSNQIYSAYGKVIETITRTGSLPVPLHIRNAPTRLMKEIGYGKNYQYAHDYENAYTPQAYLPDKIQGETYYHPTDRGYEKMVKERMKYWKKLKEEFKNEANKK